MGFMFGARLLLVELTFYILFCISGFVHVVIIYESKNIGFNIMINFSESFESSEKRAWCI